MNGNYKQCPGCAGRGVVFNQKTGSPSGCPVCDSQGVVPPLWDPLPFWYIINETIAAAAGTNVNALRIDTRAPFQWVWLIAASTTGVWSTQLTDGGSGRTYQNAAVNSENQWGTALNPFPLLVPVILKAGSVLNYTLVNRSGVAGNVIQLALGGYELYPVRAEAA